VGSDRAPGSILGVPPFWLHNHLICKGFGGFVKILENPWQLMVEIGLGNR